MKTIILIIGFLSAGVIHAAQPVITLQCGNFRFEMIANSMFKINNEYVTSQKITPLGESGMKAEMGLMPSRDGNMYGFEYIHPNGSKRRWLNVELIRTSMEQPRIIGSFDCKRINN
ncbi:hypothetical protein [Enterobacter sp. 166D1]|uniref:hypothetical protein n=1 Tax=Enterobacter TaxID=547 RepID=UPI002A80C353|nr:hypothetical protein [Enterobacter sp. 166D1]